MCATQKSYAVHLNFYNTLTQCTSTSTINAHSIICNHTVSHVGFKRGAFWRLGVFTSNMLHQARKQEDSRGFVRTPHLRYFSTAHFMCLTRLKVVH